MCREVTLNGFIVLTFETFIIPLLYYEKHPILFDDGVIIVAICD